MQGKISAALLGALLVGAGGAHAASMNATGYALSDGGATLVVVPRLDLPGSARQVPLSFGGESVTIQSIDVRPNGRRLYGYSEGTGGVYEIDIDTGEATLQATLPPSSAATSDIDFNNVLDAARVVTGDAENFVFFPADQAGVDSGEATTSTATPLFYAEGDANEGTAPMAIGNAYTNAVFPAPASTVQYVLDMATDDLAILANNEGTLTTVGSTGLDFGAMGGFDILSLDEGMNEAFALLTVGGAQGLYGIDLGTGLATFAGAVPTEFGDLDSLAVAPVPVPAAFGMLALGLAGLAGLRRARRA